MTTDTQSVLDAMVAATVERKEAKGAKLTPVGAEVAAKPPLFAADTAQLISYLHVIQDTAMHMLSLVDRIEKELVQGALEGKLPEHKELPVADAERLTEKQKVEAADPDFAARFAAQQQAAQAAVFSQPVLDEPRPGEPESGKEPAGWTCPTHGKSIEKVSPKGRHYMSCPSCDQFERVK